MKKKLIPFDDLGFAKAEPDRISRQGFPEAVYCPGKTVPQIVRIFGSLLKGQGPVLATRAAPNVARALRRGYAQARYYAQARLVIASPSKPGTRGRVAVVTAGTADLPVAEEAALTAESLGCPVTRLYDVGVAGLHRLTAHSHLIRDVEAIVVCAGMEGALASVVGGLASCPVIAVPTSIGYGAHFQGLAPLLTMLNSCAANVSVVNIDNGFSAGVIASLMANRMHASR